MDYLLWGNFCGDLSLQLRTRNQTVSKLHFRPEVLNSFLNLTETAKL